METTEHKSEYRPDTEIAQELKDAIRLVNKLCIELYKRNIIVEINTTDKNSNADQIYKLVITKKL